jgi:acetoin utilization deacetylase AcuC-like enzyme
MGFCLFNNVAVAAAHAHAALGIERVLIVDWDVHHGNGTQSIFDADPSVYYLSSHRYPHYPGTGSTAESGTGDAVGTKLNIPLKPGTTHEEFLGVLAAAIERAIAFRPGLVLISSGFDAAEGDMLGGMKLTPDTYAQATSAIRRLARAAGHERIVSVLEGGYNLDVLGECARAHFEALP